MIAVRVPPLAMLLFACVLSEATFASVADRIQFVVPGLAVRTICEIQPGTGTCALSADPNGEDVRLGPYDNLEVGNLHDAVGNLYAFDHANSLCSPSNTLGGDARLFRLRPDGSTELVLVFRGCMSPFTSVGIRDLSIDAINGIAVIRVGSGMDTEAVLEVRGLPTLLDILLSYQPPSTLSFNVPVRPEGLVGADSFSVHAGDVRTASDLSRAVPLQCIVPTGRPPVAGEHLTVADTLADPAAGEARYYLTAVNHQGQRRAGRKSVNGTLQGRNAAALPGCQ